MATVSLVVCSYTLDRWDRLRATLSRLDQQTRRPDEVILVSDRSEDLYDAFSSLGIGHVFRNEREPGVSGARNTGWDHASKDVVVFLDDDATPEPSWLERLVAPLEEHPEVVSTGGWLVPDGGHVPQWYPKELYWVFGCSWAGLEGRARLRNPIGASMAWRRETLAALGGFSTAMGRCESGGHQGSALRRPRRRPSGIAGCEETLMGIAAHRIPRAMIAHAEDSVARHYVGGERVTLSYLRRRCWGEGVSKRLVRQVGGTALEDERRHAIRMATTLVRCIPFPSRWMSATYLATAMVATVGGYLYGNAAVSPSDRRAEGAVS